MGMVKSVNTTDKHLVDGVTGTKTIDELKNIKITEIL